MKRKDLSKHPVIIFLGAVSTTVSIIVGAITIYKFISGSNSLPTVSLPIQLSKPTNAMELAINTGMILFWIIATACIVGVIVYIARSKSFLPSFFRLYLGIAIIGLVISTIAIYLGSLVNSPMVGLAIGIVLSVALVVLVSYSMIRTWLKFRRWEAHPDEIYKSI